MPRVAKKKASPVKQPEAKPKPSVQVAPAPAQPAPAVQGTVVVELPIGPQHPAKFPLHVDMRLTKGMASTLRRLMLAYDASGARLENGQRVVNANATLRKILEDIGAAIT